MIGTGLMGSSLARCLTSKGFQVFVYNRTRSKAEKLCSEINCVVMDSPKQVLEETSTVIVFVADDNALYNIIYGSGGLSEASRGSLVINASTVTPNASVNVWDALKRRGIGYLEAPVYGSVSEASTCKLVSIVAGDKALFEKHKRVFEYYSSRVYYVGEIPVASVIKLALNNLGLAMPAILAESLALLDAWGIDTSYFLEIAKNLWFYTVIERYWKRIVEEKPPRFKVWMAGKDYRYVAEALANKGLPAPVASALAQSYYNAAIHGYRDKDYPQIASYYRELARRIREK